MLPVGVYLMIMVFVAIVVWLMFGYNRLVRLRNRTQNAWAQVEVQLNRRYDLVPNLLETVKGYAEHEASTLDAVVTARSAARAATTVDRQASAEGDLTGALRHLFALAEAYPALRASDSFTTLQHQLADVEGDIAVARQIYNDTTLTYNNAVESIPTNLVAMLTGFQTGMFFETSDEGRSVPEVDF
jgi:LemA protein